jgi:hypothetical protein
MAMNASGRMAINSELNAVCKSKATFMVAKPCELLTIVLHFK